MTARVRLATVALVLVAACSDDGPAAFPSTVPTATTTVPTTAPAPTPTPAPTTSIPEDPGGGLRWWNDRVFYEVFVRSFKDSDGDGIGDLRGLTASLDYLNDGDPATTDDLGITGIWLMPIFPAPSYHGYDVTDYRSINPEYGTLADFDAFLDAAHERGIAVIIDLVLNHISTQHPWFVASAAGDPAYADWYLWSDTDPGTRAPWSDASAWHLMNGRYYFGLFWEGMPDLNVADPDVTAELRDIAELWLDRGVDGFRLDAARHLIEEGTAVSDTPATISWLERFTGFVHTVKPGALVLGEVWSPTPVVARYVPTALDLSFQFDLATQTLNGLRLHAASPLYSQLEDVIAAFPPLQYATFLTNHDMPRLMSETFGDVRPAAAAAVWLLTGPGVPFVYYGEEVGLQGWKPDPQIRTPMPWDGEAPGVGFTTGTPWEPADPGHRTANVAVETDDPDSLLTLYRDLIRARADSDALRRGDVLPVTASAGSVVAFVRSVGDEHVLVVLNVGSAAVTDLTLDLPTGPLRGSRGVEPLVGELAAAPIVGDGGGFAGYRPVEVLAPFGYLVLRFTPEPTPVPPPTTAPTATDADVAVVQQAYRASVTGDVEELERLLAPSAVVVYPDGAHVPLAQVLPPGVGVDPGADWDGDGAVTVREIIVAQNAWGALVVTGHDADCRPAGADVVCVLTQTDVFRDAAGLPATVSTQTFRVDGDRIVELTFPSADADPEAGRLVAEQLAAYEQWVADFHPDEYATAFTGPCCTGTVTFSQASIDAHRELVAEWVTSLG